MWQRFTERARRIVFFAQEEAARLGESYVGTEHLLLGLVRENDSVAARILDRLNVPLGRIRSEIEQQVTRGHGHLGQDMQLTPRAKRVIDLAYEEARQLNNNYIGTEHLLLGLIREGSGLASTVLVKLGADLERARREVYALQEEAEETGPQVIEPAGISPSEDRVSTFADEAHQLLHFAQEEAGLRNEACVGTEHLLLGMTRVVGGTAQHALSRLGVPMGRLRPDVERQAIGGLPGAPESVPITWHALRVVDLAHEAARALQNDYIGAEHLLLALLEEGDSSAAHALKEAGVTEDLARAKARQLSSEGTASSERRAGYYLEEARKQAEASRQGAVSTEHLLLSLIQEPESAAARLLEALGVSLEALRADLQRQTAPREDAAAPPVPDGKTRPFTPRSLAVIERAREQAGRLRYDRIGSDHLLLALALDEVGFGAQVLKGAGVSAQNLLRVISAARAEKPGPAPEAPADAAPPAAEAGEPAPPGPDRPGFAERVSRFLSAAAGHLYPRFTERSRRLIRFAYEEAARLGENFVGTEHLLLGLTRENDSAAARILERLGVPLGRIRSEIERQVTHGHGHLGKDIQFTPRARRALDLAYEEARQLNHNYIGTEHILLGLIREGDGLAARILVKWGADLERVRREVYAMSESEHPPGAGGTGTAAPDRLERMAEHANRTVMSPAGRRQGALHAVAAARSAVRRERRLTDLVSIDDLTPGQARALLSLAQTLKATGDSDRMAHREILPGKALAMIFEKPSLRTRTTFEVGMFQLGGHAVSLQPAEIQLGQRETVADAARNLERWVDGIMARTFSHQHVVELAQNAGVPVINGLTDREHPCQALADFLTIREKKGRTEDLKLAYLGDGNNVAHSLLLLGAKLGTHVTVAGPEGYEPDAEILQQAREAGAATGARIEVTHDPREAARDADIVYTDVWASMGQEAEAEARAPRFAAYQVNAELVKLAKWDAIVMHDLPAHRGQEITDEVMDGPQAVIFDQAENRLHAQKALLAVLLG